MSSIENYTSITNKKDIPELEREIIFLEAKIENGDLSKEAKAVLLVTKTRLLIEKDSQKFN